MRHAPHAAARRPTQPVHAEHTAHTPTPSPALPAHPEAHAGVVQRTLGNRKAAQTAAHPPRTQPRLELGAVDAPAEREAERNAARIAAQPLAASPQAGPRGTGPRGTGPRGTEPRAARVSPAALVQRATSASATEAGAEVAPAVAGRIEQQRGSGRALAPTVRRSMEHHFGANFGAVRVHDGQEADSLNQSLQAQAFTTGADIFFRHGRYQPESAGGRGLLAHELTHVVQQGGAQSSAQSSAQGGVQRTLVQRNVGFEFEAGLWKLDKLKMPPNANQKAGTEEIPDDQVNPAGLGKKSVLYKGKGWAMMADIGDDTHIEFVTDAPGFPETKEGRKQLEVAMKEMKKFCDLLIASGGLARLHLEGDSANKILSDELPVSAIMTNVLISHYTKMSAEAQTTAGLRLSQMILMLDKMKQDQQPGESKKQHVERQKALSILWGKQPRDRIVLSESGGAYLAAIAQLRERYKTTNFEGHPGGIPGNSPEMAGYVGIVRSYLITAAGEIAYAKSLAPLMARTDLATIFEGLPLEDQAFYRDFPDVFTELILIASGMEGEEGEPVFAGTSKYIPANAWRALQNGLSRQEWIYSLTAGAGRDLLTEENFPVTGVDQLLFGLGGLGEKMDTVGQKSRKGNPIQAGVFEFRRMGQSQPHHVWPSLAREIFDFIWELNNRKNPTYTGTKTIKAMMSDG